MSVVILCQGWTVRGVVQSPARKWWMAWWRLLTKFMSVVYCKFLPNHAMNNGCNSILLFAVIPIWIGEFFSKLINKWRIAHKWPTTLIFNIEPTVCAQQILDCNHLALRCSQLNYLVKQIGIHTYRKIIISALYKKTLIHVKINFLWNKAVFCQFL